MLVFHTSVVFPMLEMHYTIWSLRLYLPVYRCRGWKIRPQRNIRHRSTRTGGNTVTTLEVRIKLVQLYCYVNYHSCHRKTFMGHCKSCLEGKKQTIFSGFCETCLFKNLENFETHHYIRKKVYENTIALFTLYALQHVVFFFFFSAWFG